MSSSTGPPSDRDRVGRVYRRYAISARKQQSWRADNPGNRLIREELIRTVWELAGPQLAAARAVLDSGCGSGWWLEQLAADDRVPASLHGIELLEQRAAAARARVPAASVEVGDVCALPYGTGQFDVVTMFVVLSSLPSLERAGAALGEARRVLAPGGALLIWEPRVPNPRNPETRLITRTLLGRQLDGMSIRMRTTTLLPWLARRLGSRADRLYPLLATVSALRTHRLVCATNVPPPEP